MYVKFTLFNIKPISYNQYLYGRTKTRTQKARKWGKEVAKQCANKNHKWSFLRNSFKSHEHVISVSYTFRIPVKDYYAQSGPNRGGISSRSIDVDNCIKALQDILFEPKYHERGDIENFNIDDKYIYQVIAQKLPTNDKTYSIDIEVHIHDKPIPN